MSANNTGTNCRFCSEFAKANGVAPIGSVGNFDQWLIIEATPPWPVKIWMEPEPMPLSVVQLVNQMHAEKQKFRQLAIAPDREYSRPGYTRVFFYRRPARLFAQFEKHEFIVPEEQVGELAIALLKQPEKLSAFEPYRQQTDHIRELFVCTHGNVDAACARFGYPIYEKLRKHYADSSNGQLRVWRVSHFGGHQFAPTLVDLPIGHCWGYLEPEILDLLVHRYDSVTGLQPFYRGWAGLTQFEQIVERDIWMQAGWDWLNYSKAGQVLAVDTTSEEYPDWSEVRIDFAAPDGSETGAYEARVEISGKVTTACWSSSYEDEEPLEEVKQYQVSQLERVA